MNPPDAITPAPSTAALHADPERWVDDHGDCLYRYALTRVRKEEVAEDLVQETLLAAVRTHENFGGRSTERSWLVGILKNTDLEFFRDEHSDKFDSADYWIHERGPSDWKPEGEQAMKRAEFWVAFRGCLGRLPERVAQVFVMREVDGVPSKDVCEILHISEANLWVMLHRARMALRQDLETTFFEGKGCVTL
jgi:RNA polymerase sigma-70 factor (TIGR02943 family)